MALVTRLRIAHPLFPLWLLLLGAVPASALPVGTPPQLRMSWAHVKESSTGFYILVSCTDEADPSARSSGWVNGDDNNEFTLYKQNKTEMYVSAAYAL